MSLLRPQLICLPDTFKANWSGPWLRLISRFMVPLKRRSQHFIATLNQGNGAEVIFDCRYILVTWAPVPILKSSKVVALYEEQTTGRNTW